MIPFDLEEAGDALRKPRASGDDPAVYTGSRVRALVNPARAGMILISCTITGFIRRKPRASGDDPRTLMTITFPGA